MVLKNIKKFLNIQLFLIQHSKILISLTFGLHTFNLAFFFQIYSLYIMY